ncbi:CGNR zinc finger domain-containing protein [Deinococcus daejeonensis]|uniref:Zinc finger CGNR domain-containing protein n=1 Tax=Deinococcus daejeonensis TaxID=1007098 RepID=A0ABQ2J1D2_9DEIO|nr:CGNR zinc finger domain-containing protein [Deinococcus daejeonensis]GGN34651.1 hypothetical protein GCM10010842_13560 [Deinococcus daejeonensis]
MAESIQMFCHWSAEFAVEYVDAPSAGEDGRLRFVPMLRDDRLVRREWFTRWHRQALTGKPLPTLLNTLLPLSGLGVRSDEFKQAVVQVAGELGPLFTALPWHGLASNAFYEESPKMWHDAAVKLADLGRAMGCLSSTSRDGSEEANLQRAEDAAEGEFGRELLDMISAKIRQELIESRLDSPGISPMDHLEGEISRMMDRLWIIPLRNEEESDARLALPRLRLSPEDHTLQLNLPFGIQALLVMMIHDKRLGRSVLLRDCARPDCRVVRFMQPSQRFCSAKCQKLDAVRRHRAKAREASALAEISQID